MHVVSKMFLKINALPDNVTIETIMEELYFKAVVDKGLLELEQGKGIPQHTGENMANLQIRDIDDRLYESLKQRAECEHRSIARKS